MSDDETNEFSLVVDAHVHIHDCYPLGAFLDAAEANLAAAARGPRFEGILMLTETFRDDAFGRLAAAASSGRAPEGGAGWRIEPTSEPESVRATAADGRSVFLVAGRQVAAAEDLEVLLLGTDARLPDGLPLRRILDLAEERGVLRAIPWGPGKWFFDRGRIVSEVLRDAPRDRFFLGDESARPVFWPTPRHFVEARHLGIRVLRGTDPLPFPREARRAGSYGFRLRGPSVAARPAESLRRLLADPGTELHDFGVRETPGAFVRNQVAMQLRKRARRRARDRSED